MAAVDRRSSPSRPSATDRKGPLSEIVAIRRGEWPLALLLFGYFFTVVTTFWILKPLKKGLFIGFFRENGVALGPWHGSAAQAELVAKVLNMFVAFGAATLFTALSRRLRRQRLTYALTALLAIAFVVFAFVARTPSAAGAWSFYLFGDLYSTLMVASFFAFANDSVDPDTAKRIYGVVGLGGVAGGALGSTMLVAATSRLSISSWMFACIGSTAVISVLAWGAGRIVRRRGAPERPPAREQRQGSAAWEGARLAARSRYLLSIVAIVGLYEMVSTIMDFQFTSSVARALSAPEIPGHFAKVFAITNWVALAVQLLLTSFVMRRLGLTTALLVLPIAAALGSLGFFIAPGLVTGSALNTADNSFSYSINQSAKEVLYVPTRPEEKYAAKAFIDMFLQRFSKALAVVISLGFSIWFAGGSGVRWLSLWTLGLLAVWAFVAVSAGRRFHALEREQRASRA